MDNDDPKLAAILKSGEEGDVVILGSPFDFVRKRCIHKGGEENGPCYLRRFFNRVGPLVNPQHGISIKEVSVSDAGNAQFQPEHNNLDPQRCIDQIAEKVYSIIKNKRIPFVFGGSKESLYASVKAFHKLHPHPQHILISGKPSLRRAYDSNKLTSDSALTLLSDQYPNSITLFSAHDLYFPTQYSKQFKHISYTDIRRTVLPEESPFSTQAAYALQRHLEEGREVHVSLTVEAIEGFKGCRDVMSVGITPEEMVEIFMMLGSDPRIGLIDISQFNPSVEGYESSLLLVNLLYYFLLGFTKRNVQ